MAYTHFYDYTCTESSETRGSRVTKTTACGWSSVRATKEEISESFKPQARPCDRCTRRMRLNKGNTNKAPDLMVKKMIRDSRNPCDRTLYSVDSDIPDYKARKQYAHDRADARNQHRFGIDSNTSEQVDETIEQVPKTIEHNSESFEDIGGVLIE